MKKIIAIVVTLIVALTSCIALSACGSTKEETIIIKDLVLVKEEYGIAGRKDDKALISQVNAALIALRNSELKTIADRYGLTSELAINDSTVNPLADAADDSFEKIKQSKKLIIGYTVYAPIAYNDDNGNFVGFDTDLAKAVAKYLSEQSGVDIAVEFQLIQWASKETNLNEGTIDLIWNGLTINEDRKAAMCISVPYLYNNQVAVIRKADEGKYNKDLTSFKNAIMGSEKGSAGEEIINEKELGGEKLTFKSQLDAYNQLKAGSVDIIVIDSVMANYYINKK